jgi:hypothetical protein
VTGEVLRVEEPTLFEYQFGMGDEAVKSHVRIALTQDSEAVSLATASTVNAAVFTAAATVCPSMNVVATAGHGRQDDGPPPA